MINSGRQFQNFCEYKFKEKNKWTAKMSFNIGSELDKQIYPEGKPTWGCKSGVLDVEDVKSFIKEILEERPMKYSLKEWIKLKAGGTLI